METMVQYGMMAEWDQRIRAQAQPLAAREAAAESQAAIVET